MNRRHFVFSMLAALPVLLFRTSLFGQAPAGNAAKDLALPLVPESDPMAKALNYCENADKGMKKVCPKRAERAEVAAGQLPRSKQYCDNCQFYTAVGKKGKDEVGKCQVLKPGQGLVKAKGWCNSWVQNPKAKT